MRSIAQKTIGRLRTMVPSRRKMGVTLLIWGTLALLVVATLSATQTSLGLSSSSQNSNVASMNVAAGVNSDGSIDLAASCPVGSFACSNTSTTVAVGFGATTTTAAPKSNTAVTSGPSDPAPKPTPTTLAVGTCANGVKSVLCAGTGTTPTTCPILSVALNCVGVAPGGTPVVTTTTIAAAPAASGGDVSNYTPGSYKATGAVSNGTDPAMGPTSQTDLVGNWASADYTKDPIALLPAYRWSNSDTTRSYGKFELLHDQDPLYAGAADFEFSISGGIWKLLLILMNWALNIDLVHSAADKINQGFVDTSLGLFGSGLISIAYLIMTIAMIKAMMDGQVKKAVSILVGFALALGAISALGNASSGTVTGTEAFGSPAWIAEQGAIFDDQVAGSISGGFGLLNGNALNATGINSTTDLPNCTVYDQTLYNYFTYYAEGPNKTDPADDVIPNSSRSSLATISQMWEVGFADEWYQAQYGAGTTTGERAGCHRLEQIANITPHEQAVLSLHAYGPGMGHASGVNGWDMSSKTSPTEDTSGAKLVFPDTWEPFEPNKINGDVPDELAYTRIFSTQLDSDEDGDNSIRDIWAWSVCKWDTGQKKMVVEDNFSKIGVSNDDCQRWWDTGTFRATGNSGDGPFLPSKASAGASSQGASLWKAANGHNGSERVTLGFISLIVAGVWVWGLGLLGVSALAAQLGLFVLLVCLPATLFMCAVPGLRGMGVKMLKLTGVFMLNRLFLVGAMNLILFLTLTLQQVNI